MEKDKVSNIAAVHDCFGCGVCATICNHNAISITLNKKGFYEPSVDSSSCVHCGLCLRVCGFLDTTLPRDHSQKRFYAGWSLDDCVRKHSTSGGIMYEVSRYLLEKGYTFCGVKYNAEKGVAEHFLTNSIKDLVLSQGSKYIQSYTLDAFKQIKRNNHYIVVGTPCQIDSIRRFIKLRKIEENFVLMDFFCHSIPSMYLWNYYKARAAKRIGKIQGARWRSKTSDWDYVDGHEIGWHDSYVMVIKGDEGVFQSPHSDHDIFHDCFIFNMCCSPACIKNCKYKQLKSAADIRLGDFWGEAYIDDNKGVNSVITLTDKGNQILHSLRNIYLHEVAPELILGGQMKKNVTPATLSAVVWLILKYNIQIPKMLWKNLIRIELFIKNTRKTR